MEHAVWKGHVAFGLLTIPVRLYLAERKPDLHFHLLDSRNQARIHYERINDETGQEVPWDKTVTAFEYDKGNYIILDREDLNIKTEPSPLIEILHFVEKNTIDPIYFSKPYYLEADESNDKGYILLREALNKSNKCGICKIVIRRRQHVAALVSFQNALILNVLRYSHEIIPPAEFKIPLEELDELPISLDEMKLAIQLIDTLTTVWDASQYHDEYQYSLKEAIEEKIKSQKKSMKNKRKEKFIKSASNAVDFINIIKKTLTDVSVKPTKRARRSRTR